MLLPSCRRIPTLTASTLAEAISRQNASDEEQLRTRSEASEELRVSDRMLRDGQRSRRKIRGRVLILESAVREYKCSTIKTEEV